LEYKTVLNKSLLQVNTVISFDVTTRLIIVLIVIFASLVFKIPLRPAQMFTAIPLIYLVVKTLVWRCIFYQSMVTAEVRVTAGRIEVMNGMLAHDNFL
jgi:hypothetical protein